GQHHPRWTLGFCHIYILQCHLDTQIDKERRPITGAYILHYTTVAGPSSGAEDVFQLSFECRRSCPLRSSANALLSEAAPTTTSSTPLCGAVDVVPTTFYRCWFCLTHSLKKAR
ncbi:hypothetical protein PIB30_086510, partial [Stylosanthes scabra]|nr:hypothetical protein [Stylosanthes scabra]